jgi:hypothetical protein
VQPLAAERGLDLRVEIASGTPTEMETDPQRFEQILARDDRP